MPHDPSARAERGQGPAPLRPWRAPALEELPALESLTLQSPIVGGEGGFGFLDSTDSSRRLG